MINKIFSVATFTLLAWLTVTLVTTSQQLSDKQLALSIKIESNHQTLASRISALEHDRENAHKAVIAKLDQQIPHPRADDADLTRLKSEIGSLQARLSEKGNLTPLKTAYIKILETEFEKKDNAVVAAEKLLGTKEAIWKASTQHVRMKEDLQGLMAPIDVLAAQWKRGETNGSVKPVFDILQASLASLDTE